MNDKRRHIITALGVAMLALPSAVWANTPAPVWNGVWRGTIGTAAMQACMQSDGLDNPFGAYFYMRHLGIISIGSLSSKAPADGGPPNWTENPLSDHPEKGPIWSFTQISRDQMSGTWSDGKKRLPIKLTRVPIEKNAPAYAGDGPCGSLAFNMPRYTKPVITTKPAVLDGVAYTSVLVDASKKGSDDPDSGSFQLIDNTPAIARVNRALNKDIPTGPANDINFQCSISALSANGMDGDASSSTHPLIITHSWMVSAQDSQDDCGGAHPNSDTSYTTWDLRKGEAISLFDWFNAAALTQKRDSPTDNYPTITYTPAFRKLMDDAYVEARGDDKDCAESVKETDTWQVYLDAEGIAFVPFMSHAEQACTDSAIIPFAKLAAYLTQEGRVGVASFAAEANALHKREPASK